MPGLKVFSTETFGFRQVAVKTTAYTVLASDEKVQCNPTSTMVLTLPAINSFQGSTQPRKAYLISNGGTASVTITPSADTVTAVSNTIGGRSNLSLKPNESVVISASCAETDWKIDSPYPRPLTSRAMFSAAITTSGTTPQHVFDASGAPTNIAITGILCVATVTLAGNVVVKNGTDTVVTHAKLTSAIGATNGAVSLSNTNVAAGSACTVEMSGADMDCTVIIFGTAQSGY